MFKGLSQYLLVRFVRKKYMYCSLKTANLVSIVVSSIRYGNPAGRNVEKKKGINLIKREFDIQRTVHRDTVHRHTAYRDIFL